MSFDNWTTFVQRRPNVFDVGPALYKRYTNVFCLLGYSLLSRSKTLQPTLPPVTGPVHSCVISTPRGVHIHLTISALVLVTYHTDCYLCPTKYLLWVKWSTCGCSALSIDTVSKQQWPSVERGQTHDCYPKRLKTCIKRELNSHDMQQQLQSAML